MKFLSTTFSEAGIEALIGGTEASAALGPEFLAAELVFASMALGIKKLKNHHDNKKQAKEDQR